MLHEQHRLNESNISVGNTFHEIAAPGRKMHIQSFDKIISEPSGSNAGDPLGQLKGRICQLLDDYISSIDLGCIAIPYKFSFFGHHHDDRARVVKQAILDANDADEIVVILNSQEVAFAKGVILVQHPDNLDSRWFQDTPGNLPQFNLRQSGYYSQIQTAFDDYKNYKESQSQNDDFNTDNDLQIF